MTGLQRRLLVRAARERDAAAWATGHQRMRHIARASTADEWAEIAGFIASFGARRALAALAVGLGIGQAAIWLLSLVFALLEG